MQRTDLRSYESRTCAIRRCCFRYNTTFDVRTAYGHGRANTVCNGAKERSRVATKVAEEFYSRVARRPHSVRAERNSMLVLMACEAPMPARERRQCVLFFDASERMQSRRQRICKMHGMGECREQQSRRHSPQREAARRTRAVGGTRLATNAPEMAAIRSSKTLRGSCAIFVPRPVDRGTGSSRGHLFSPR